MSHQRGAGVELPVALVEGSDSQLATTVLQPLQPGRKMGLTSSQSFRDQARGTPLENLQALASTEAALLPYEDFMIIRRGRFDNSEKTRLAAALNAAVAWTHDQAVQIVIDNRMAIEDSSAVGLQSVSIYELPKGKPKLRVVKVASQQDALSGDVVDFTLRFDNLGNETIGNVTVIDNLVTRLEYVPDSQECSLEAEFMTEPNEDESQTLRWEIKHPLKVGEGGVIRFQCRVR